jgi:hypothetical protein
MGNKGKRHARNTILVWLCAALVACTQGVLSMATNTATRTTSKALTTGTTSAVLAPSIAPTVPMAPTTVPLANWHIAGTASTAKQATNGVGPAPKAGTVGHAALACIAQGGATMAMVQAAVTAVGLRGKHPALQLLRWLAANRGYTFTCTNGVVSHG